MLFLLPLGLLEGAELSISDVIVKNPIAVTIGNAIAGAIVVGAGYGYAFGKLGESDEAAECACSYRNLCALGRSRNTRMRSR